MAERLQHRPSPSLTDALGADAMQALHETHSHWSMTRQVRALWLLWGEEAVGPSMGSNHEELLPRPGGPYIKETHAAGFLGLITARLWRSAFAKHRPRPAVRLCLAIECVKRAAAT